MKLISIFIYLLACLTDLMITSKSNAKSNHIDFCENIRYDRNCLEIINNLPPINRLPKLNSSGPIPIEVIPYRKKYTSVKQKKLDRRNKFTRNEDSYLYELR